MEWRTRLVLDSRVIRGGPYEGPCRDRKPTDGRCRYIVKTFCGTLRMEGFCGVSAIRSGMGWMMEDNNVMLNTYYLNREKNDFCYPVINV